MTVADYITAGRARKVSLIVEAIDRAWRERGANILDEEIVTKTLARLEGMSRAEWRALCTTRAIREPSPETAADVIRHFKDRLEQIQESRLEPKGEQQ